MFFTLDLNLGCFLLLLKEDGLIKNLFVPKHVIKYTLLLMQAPSSRVDVLPMEMLGTLFDERVLDQFTGLRLGSGQVGVLQSVLIELGVEGPVDTLVVGEDDVALGHHVVTRLVLDLQLEP